MQMTPGNAAMKAARLPATDVDLLVVGGGFTGLSAAL
ncbi:MAG TPA: pyridine nucleotide-disulfide oxidoreductase, partial [Alphaproteobacteria bacterium]|nr:pyridine nucleotide-disulfide oxidoreductase [Alphaproteobacteria bacterium]